MKKNNRLLIGIGVLAAMGASWYMLINNASTINEEYNTYISEARRQSELKIYTDAIDNYSKAYQLKPTLELGLEYAEIYNRNEDERAYESMLNELVDDYPEQTQTYELLGNYYIDNNEYDEVLELKNKIEYRKVSSEGLNELFDRLSRVYDKEGLAYASVSEYVNGMCAVQNEDGSYGYINERGQACVSGKYAKVTGFSSAGRAAVMTGEGECILIDTEGNRKSADNVEGRIIEDCHRFNGVFAAKINGKYTFLNEDYSDAFGNYDDAGSFSYGLAPVKEGEKWYVINSEGMKISEEGYEEIKVTENEIAFGQDRFFAVESGNTVMLNGSGEKVGDNVYEDARPFNDSGYAAVKINGKWGYIDTEGKTVIEPQYDNARSFSNGKAAVCLNGLWGYIDANGNEKTEYIFEDARNLTSSKTALTKENGKWQIIKFYI